MKSKKKAPRKDAPTSQQRNYGQAQCKLTEIFNHVADEFIPQKNTNYYRLLSILSDGKPHPKIELLLALGDDPRSTLQKLRNETFGFWLIHNIGEHKAVYQLDQAHLLSDLRMDILARAKARALLKQRSRAQAVRESNRVPSALVQEQKAKELLDTVKGGA